MSFELEILIFILLALALSGFVVLLSLRQSSRRAKLEHSPLPGHLREILEKRMGIYSILPSELRTELEGRANVFLAEKQFEGCGGLQITDEIRVIIAANAALLLLNNELDYYPRLRTILVYPDAYRVESGMTSYGGQRLESGPSIHAGDSWSWGTVILSWEDVRHDSCRIGGGQNVAIHEFAHQIDQADGVADGIPAFSDRERQRYFAGVVRREFDNLRHEVEVGIRDVIDAYGALNPAEFFAVSTEIFFCAPKVLFRHHRELYLELRKFYCVDPAGWG